MSKIVTREGIFGESMEFVGGDLSLTSSSGSTAQAVDGDILVKLEDGELFVCPPDLYESLFDEIRDSNIQVCNTCGEQGFEVASCLICEKDFACKSCCSDHETSCIVQLRLQASIDKDEVDRLRIACKGYTKKIHVACDYLDGIAKFSDSPDKVNAALIITSKLLTE